MNTFEKTRQILQKPWIILVIFAIIGIIIYFNALDNEMFWDDNDGIINNLFIKDWSYFPKFFSENLIAGSGLMSNYWRPLLLAVFSFQWHLWQNWVYGFHFINIITHIASAFVLFVIFKKLFKNHFAAILTSLMFLIHPLQTEAVTYVSGLADPLSVLFILLSAYFLMKFRDRNETMHDSWNYLVSVLFFICALLTKDSAVVAAGIIGLIDFFYSNSETRFWKKLKSTLKILWPFLALTGLYAILRATSLNFQNTFNLYNETNEYTGSFSIRLFTFLKILSIYFGLLIWPNNLHMERTTELARTFLNPQVIIGALILFFLIFTAIKFWKSKPVISFGSLWFLGVLFPHSNLLVPTAGLLYEHWLYLPQAGIWLAVFWLILSIRKNTAIKYPILALLTLLMAVFCVKTISRNNDWDTAISFYEQTSKYAPQSYRIINNLGMAYADKNIFDKAEINYQKAISIDPNNAVAVHNLGNVYLNTNRPAQAIELFEKAISLQPNFYFSYNALAKYYLDNKKYPDARDVIERHMSTIGINTDQLLLLTQISFEEKNFPQAKNYIDQAKQIDPSQTWIKQAESSLPSLTN